MLLVPAVWASLLFCIVIDSTKGCPEHEHHGQHHFSSSRIGSSRSSSSGLIRPLQWGDVQILHTTDIHGWYQGHQAKAYPEEDFSGDWGDFASFVSYMRKLAKKQGVDLLLVDSGDLHDGAGLSDGYPPGQGPDAHFSNQFHSMIDFDILTVGNHELYVYANALDTFQNFVPQQSGRYLASNVNITYTDADGTNVTEPMGQRFAKFQTDGGRKVTSLGVLYNFQGQAPGLIVQPPAQMINETWFLEVIQEEVDFFLLAGHMPVRNDDWPVVVDAIRAMHPRVPIIIAGGHTHIRDCYIYDENAFGIESGRYLETIGWLSFNLTSNSSSSTSFSRTYIDGNRRNYAFHANLTNSEQLATSEGTNITQGMDKLAQTWNLTEVFGTSPSDFYLSRIPASSPSSLLHLLTQEVLPTVISTSNPNRTEIPNLVIANSGSQRFDIYKGPFTKNDQFIVSPFKDDFLYLEQVPFQYANVIVDGLNKKSSISTVYRNEDSRVDAIRSSSLQASFEGARVKEKAHLTLGYVTKDSCPGIGDDTEHNPIPYANQPDFVASPLSNNLTEVGADDLVDVVFLDFALNDIVEVLNNLQKDRVFKTQDASPYNSLTTQDLYRLYAIEAWN